MANTVWAYEKPTKGFVGLMALIEHGAGAFRSLGGFGALGSGRPLLVDQGVELAGEPGLAPRHRVAVQRALG